jgi:hypothetical protein
MNSPRLLGLITPFLDAGGMRRFTRADVKGGSRKRIPHALLAVVVGLTGFLVAPAALQADPLPSCVGLDACDGNAGTIAEGACGGEEACRHNQGDIRKSACIGYLACFDNTGDIGEGSCEGWKVCPGNTGRVAKRSCRGSEACFANTGSAGEASCRGDYACEFNSGPIGKLSCHGELACSVNTGSVGEASCVGDSACEANSGPIGKLSCRGERACIGNTLPIGDHTCNGDPDPVTGKGVCELAPVAWWTYDDCREEGSRILVPDRSGNHLHGVATDAFQCVNGLAGEAGSFDGVDDRVEVADDPLLHFTTALTVSVLVKPSTVAGPHAIINKHYALDSFALSVVDGQYLFTVVRPGGVWGKPVSITAPARFDEWAHVVGTFDGKRVTLYVNGVAAVAADAEGSIQDSIRPVVMGNHPSWVPYAGLIDDVRLYDVVLGAPAVARLFCALLPASPAC